MINFFSLLIFLSILHSSYDQEVDIAINQLYNFEIEQAINSLELLSVKYPKDPLIPFLKISSYWQQSLLYEDPEASYEIINNGIRDFIPFYLDMIEKYPENQHYKLFLGSLYGLKARIHLAKSEWMSLIVSGAKGFKYIKDALSEDPYLYDAYMPIGTLEYVLCRSGKPLQLIGEVFGLKSDCTNAITKLEFAADSSKYSWIESKNVLSYIYLYAEKDFSKALKHSSTLSNEFPGHPFFAYLEAESLVRLERYEDFNLKNRKLIRFYQEGPVNQRSECYDKYLYLKALRFYQKENYDRAIIYCNEVISEYDTEFQWILGYVHLIKGKSHEMLGDRSTAIYDYQMAAKYLNNWPDQEYAQELIRRPLSENYKTDKTTD